MAANWRGNTIRGGVNPFRSSPARRPISITSILLFFVLLLLPLSRKAYCTARKKRRKEEEECALSRPDKREEDLKAWQTAYENPLDTTLKDSSYPLKITITFRYFISFSAPCLLLYTLIYLHTSLHQIYQSLPDKQQECKQSMNNNHILKNKSNMCMVICSLSDSFDGKSLSLVHGITAL